MPSFIIPTPLRRFLVEARQQLRTLDICTTNDVERIGHWNKGSRMPDAYDNASGVSELQARHRVLEAIRGGWRLVHEGELPVQPNSIFANQRFVMVANKKTQVIHSVAVGRRTSKCGMWTCGTSDESADNADFVYIPVGWKRCKCSG